MCKCVHNPLRRYVFESYFSVFMSFINHLIVPHQIASTFATENRNLNINVKHFNRLTRCSHTPQSSAANDYYPDYCCPRVAKFGAIFGW